MELGTDIVPTLVYSKICDYSGLPPRFGARRDEALSPAPLSLGCVYGDCFLSCRCGRQCKVEFPRRRPALFSLCLSDSPEKFADFNLVHASEKLSNSPQAKGRVELLFKTLHDRLIREIRLQGGQGHRRGECVP